MNCFSEQGIRLSLINLVNTLGNNHDKELRIKGQTSLNVNPKT